MVNIIEHIKVNDAIIKQIIDIKSLWWPYSYHDHLKWINSHVTPNDLHLMMYENDELISYMNLVRVNVQSEKNAIPFLGVGNVCTRYKGRGDGKKLMKAANDYLTATQSHGLLFCKSHLVDFYQKNDWRLIKNLYPADNVFTLTYNFTGNDTSLSYTDRLF